VVALLFGSLVRDKIDISHLIWCWATVERTVSYARGDRGFVAGYGLNSVAGHGSPPSCPCGEWGGSPLLSSSSFFSSLCPKPAPHPLFGTLAAADFL
jgi:hypothetical protein